MLAPPNLTTELDDVMPAQVRRRVSASNRRDRTAVWEPGWSAEVQVEALDRDLGQREQEVDAVADAKIRRVDLQVRIEGDVQPVEAKPRLVHERLAEDVRFVDRHDLPVTAARVAEVRHGVALRVRLLPFVGLECVVSVEVVVLA